MAKQFLIAENENFQMYFSLDLRLLLIENFTYLKPNIINI